MGEANEIGEAQLREKLALLEPALQEAAEIQRILHDKERQESVEQRKRLIGTCWKRKDQVQSNYPVHTVYYMITGVDEVVITGHSFCLYYGYRYEIAMNDALIHPVESTEISREEFDAAWLEVLQKLNQLVEVKGTGGVILQGPCFALVAS